MDCTINSRPRSNVLKSIGYVFTALALLSACGVAAAPALQLEQLDPRVLPVESDPAGMLSRDIRRRLTEANDRESAAWREIRSLEDWQRYVKPRIQALRERLGIQKTPDAPPKFLVTGKHSGEGYEIQNVVFESRPGLAVSANLYRPHEPRASMPAILIVHSHHAPKTQNELQDMGITWARQGAVVLVMDLPGHGERRQHKFADESNYPRMFRVSRQDYYFRYNTGLQLPLVGQSLMAWMVHDLRRGIDLVVSLPGVDKTRIALLGAVAGGGDPCAVTAAVDERITLAAPFNFGGPQPESTFPLPDDAETRFNYAGGGSWESTRNLQFSASEGFLSWVIVGSLAPRGLVYGHEFSWDRPRDPVWKRLETIFGFYQASDRLSYAQGRGRLSGQPPEATHCTNIGPVHRERIHLALRDWLGLAIPEKEATERRPATELLAMTSEARSQFQPRLIHEIAAASIEKDRQANLREHWSQALGDIRPSAVRVIRRDRNALIERVAVETQPGIQVPLLLLLPDTARYLRPPVVIGMAQAGKQGFLKHRAETINALLAGGAAVCLPDLRGTGETQPGEGRGRTSSATSLSSSAWMLGQTMLGWRLKDLRGVCRWLQTCEDLDADRLVLWGESFAPVNDPSREFDVPWDAENLPSQSEPGGALLALFGGLFEEHVRGVYARGGLVSYQSLLESPYLYVPHDAAVPFAVTGNDVDLPAVAAALGPRPLNLEAQVDGRNRLVGPPASDQAAVAQWLLNATR